MDFIEPWKGRRVIVTGGSGFIGQHVLSQGKSAGVELHDLSLSVEADEGVSSHEVDLRNRQEVFRIVADVQPAAVIHLAAAGVSYGSGTFSDLLQINLLGTDNLLSAAAGLEPKPHVVIAGTGYEYAPQDHPISEDDPVAPRSAYGISKAAAALCAGYYASGMPITLLRLFNVYGPGERESRLIPYIVRCAEKDIPAEVSQGLQVRDFTYVGHVAEAFWRALSLPSRDETLAVFNVGTGVAVVLKQAVELLAQLLRSRGLDPQLHWGAIPTRPDEPKVYVANVARMQQAFRWTPPPALSWGLQQTIESML
jgi:UDP-glucose 4-epimerase